MTIHINSNAIIIIVAINPRSLSLLSTIAGGYRRNCFFVVFFCFWKVLWRHSVLFVYYIPICIRSRSRSRSRLRYSTVWSFGICSDIYHITYYDVAHEDDRCFVCCNGALAGGGKVDCGCERI